MRAAFAHIDCWIFDLDNSLYPASTDLFRLIDCRMGAFIGQLLEVDAAEARRIQKHYFREHGTTLAGLMRAHGVDPREFLHFVHDIDLARLTADPAVVAGLDRLPGRKFVFTNSDEAHARRVLDRIGLANAFDGLHDIHAMDYLPKPDPKTYALMCGRYAIDPETALFVDDMARNLAPAKALGMATVWLDNGSEQAGGAAAPEYVDHVAADLGAWLEAVLEEEIA